MDQAFSNADTNKDGQLSKQEVKNLLSEADGVLSHEEFDYVFNYIDKDNNGLISKQELQEFADSF